MINLDDVQRFGLDCLIEPSDVVRYRGQWDAGCEYKPGDVVLYNPNLGAYQPSLGSASSVFTGYYVMTEQATGFEPILGDWECVLKPTPDDSFPMTEIIQMARAAYIAAR